MVVDGIVNLDIPFRLVFNIHSNSKMFQEFHGSFSIKYVLRALWDPMA